VDVVWGAEGIDLRERQLGIGPHTADCYKHEDTEEQERMPQHPEPALRLEDSLRTPDVLYNTPTIVVRQREIVHRSNDEWRRPPPLAGVVGQREHLDRVDWTES
jgi:hypothetical protein